MVIPLFKMGTFKRKGKMTKAKSEIKGVMLSDLANSLTVVACNKNITPDAQGHTSRAIQESRSGGPPSPL